MWFEIMKYLRWDIAFEIHTTSKLTAWVYWNKYIPYRFKTMDENDFEDIDLMIKLQDKKHKYKDEKIMDNYLHRHLNQIGLVIFGTIFSQDEQKNLK